MSTTNQTRRYCRLGRRDSVSYENGGPDSESHRQSTDPPDVRPNSHRYVLTVEARARPRLAESAAMPSRG